MTTMPDIRHIVATPEFLPFPESRPIPRSHLVVLMALRRLMYVERSVAALTHEIEGLRELFPEISPPAARTVYSTLAEFCQRGLVERRVQKRHANGRWLKPRVVFRLSGSPVDHSYASRLVAAVVALGWGLPSNIGPTMPCATDDWTAISAGLKASQ